jgi:hypothetical protein
MSLKLPGQNHHTLTILTMLPSFSVWDAKVVYTEFYLGVEAPPQPQSKHLC